MKKYKGFIIAMVALFLGGCVTANVAPPLKPQEVKIRIEGVDAVKVASDDGKIARSMEVRNQDLEFSHNCSINGDTAYITITSISSYNVEDLWKDFQLMKLKNIKKAVIYLNSPGGEAFQGLALTDEMRLAKEGINLTVEGRGLIASAAIPVLVMADRRICSKNTIFLIHPASLTKWGLFTETLKDLESQAKMINMLNNGYAQSVADKTNLTREEVLEMMKHDNWFTAEEALKMGFVDEVR